MNINIDKLLLSINTTKYVAGFTHDFYRYPARFSPIFAKEIIEAFTNPGETVLDPFMGGATSLIEATILGRRAIGVDISPLAAFLARTKTTPLNREELEHLQFWLTNRVKTIKFNQKSIRMPKWKAYQRNIPWRIRKIMELILQEIKVLRNKEG